MFAQTLAMSDYLNISDFLSPLNLHMLSDDEGYKDKQMGSVIKIYSDEFPELDEADIVFVGCGEQRGYGLHHAASEAPNEIRKAFYKLYFWHHDLKLADIGNIKAGANLGDSIAALKTVVHALTNDGKTVIILGGSHDLTLAQYQSYFSNQKSIEATCIDALIDLDMDSVYRTDNFLMEMLTGEPNFIRHYNHIGFQSYYIHPKMLETLDKLRFDCFRVGHVKETIEEMEPVLRNSQMLSVDISAIASGYVPGNSPSPNGLSGEDACVLMQYAGMSPNINTIGIYGYRPELDTNAQAARQISQMLWYIFDGRSRGNREAALDEKESFNEYHLAFAEVDTTFLQSKKTGRWWMQLPDKSFIACSFKDYMLASSNEIPERWLRAQERS